MRKINLLLCQAVLAGFMAVTAANAQSYGEYTLIAPQGGMGNGGTTASIIDLNQNTYHSWTFASNKKTAYSSYMQHDTLVRTYSVQNSVFQGGGGTGGVQKVAWDGTVIWDYTYSSATYFMHHDICPMPNGNVLIISYELKTSAEYAQAGGTSTLNNGIHPDKIIEVQPTGATTGNIVWEWHVWDHLVQSADATKDNYYASVNAHPELLNINYNATTDWMHTNGIDYNPELDQVVISSHNLNELYVIDHSTTTAEAATHAGGTSGKGGDFLYRWGNPAAYGASGTADFNVVHDAHWVPQGSPHAGYLAGFNNNGVSNNVSSIDLVNPPLSGNAYTMTGGVFGPSTFTIRDTCAGHAQDMGNSQQLPNGNTLICIATAGKVYEIDSNKAVLWTYQATGTIPQAFRYTACYFNNTSVSTPTVTQSGDTLASTAAGTYQWCQDGVAITGATSQVYVPTQNGTYTVQVADVNNCSSATSAAFAYTSPTAVTAVTGNNSNVTMYPNPTTGIVYLGGVKGNFEVMVYDGLGRKVMQEKNFLKLDLSGYDGGIYHISITPESGAAVSNTIMLTGK